MKLERTPQACIYPVPFTGFVQTAVFRAEQCIWLWICMQFDHEVANLFSTFCSFLNLLKFPDRHLFQIYLYLQIQVYKCKKVL